MISRSFPAGSILLVLQAPKEETLVLGRWYTRRFPGRRPEPGATAREAQDALVRELADARRAAGADGLLVTAGGFAWLRRRPRLARHLERYPSVAPFGATLLYSLRTPPASQLRSFLDSLLPAGCTVAVAGSDVASLLQLGEREAWPFPRHRSGAYAPRADPLAAAEEVRAAGAEFLVLPSFTPSWLDHHPGFAAALARRHPRVVARENLCEVFDLTRPPGRIGRALG